MKEKILNRIKICDKKIIEWANRSIYTKLLLAILIETLKLVAGSFTVWITGLFLISYLTSLPFISFGQCILLCLWFKIIIFNMAPTKIKN